MWTFSCGVSVSKKSNKILELEEKLYSSDALQEILRRQALVIDTKQVTVTHDLLQNCFTKKKLPYYNLVEFETQVLDGTVGAYSPICILSLHPNVNLVCELFVDCVLTLPYIEKHLDYCGTKNIKLFFLKSKTLKQLYTNIMNWLDIIDMNIDFFADKFDRTNDKLRTKETIKLLYKQMMSVNLQRNPIGHPFIEDAKGAVRQAMLPAGQEWRPNVAFCTVRYTHNGVQGTFELLYSIEPIAKGHRLFYNIPKTYQNSLLERIKSRWPLVLQVDDTVYLPKQLWNMPVLVAGVEINLYDLYQQSAPVPDFELTHLKKYYDKFKTGTLEDKYNILVCTKKKQIQFVSLKINF